MIHHFQLTIGESAPSDSNFPGLLSECRDMLEKIIMGTERGYRLRDPGNRLPAGGKSPAGPNRHN